MPKRSVLADIVQSAIGAKAHFEIWWAQASEARPSLLRQMNEHSDFFNASYDAHYLAYHVYVGQLFDTTPRTASIQTYLKEVRNRAPDKEFKALESEYKALSKRSRTLVVARHKTVAHVDSMLTEKEVFQQADPITYTQARDLIYDVAQFVAKLAGHADSPGQIGIGRDRRLVEATLKLIRALP